jgi:hypothetical protein
MKTKHIFWIVVVMLGSTVVGYCQDSRLPKIFEPMRADQLQEQPLVGQEVVRYQPVRARLDILQVLQPGDAFAINPMPGIEWVGIVDRVERHSQHRFSIFAQLRNIPHGVFICAVEEDAMAATIHAPIFDLNFGVRYWRDGLHLIRQIDERKLNPCGNRMIPLDKGKRDARRANGNDPLLIEPVELKSGTLYEKLPPRGDFSPQACDAPVPVFDVMVVFTTRARDAAGGTNAIVAQINDAINQANQIYQNSQINARMRLVDISSTTYDETGRDFDDHLGAIDSSPSVAQRRNLVSADFVSFWVRDDELCGLAWCDSDDPDDAFSVVDVDCATSGFSFTHEIGHNQGCDHNREDRSTFGFCADWSYSYGWRFTGNDNQQYRTIMAYATDPFANATRIMNFSNPDVFFMGRRTGVPIGQSGEAHNARTLNNNALISEDLKPGRYDLWVDFLFTGTERGNYYQPFRTLAWAIAWAIEPANALGRPTIWIKTGTTSERPRITKPLRIVPCGGRVRIGG